MKQNTKNQTRYLKLVLGIRRSPDIYPPWLKKRDNKHTITQAFNYRVGLILKKESSLEAKKINKKDHTTHPQKAFHSFGLILIIANFIQIFVLII